MEVRETSATYTALSAYAETAVPNGYQQTEVGVIPVEWKVRPILSLVRIANGQVNPRVEPYKSMVLVAPDHIESSTGRLYVKETAGEQRAISGKYQFERGDIVYSKIRPYLRKAILATFSGLCSADMYPLKPLEHVSPGFVLAVILGSRFSKYAESVSVRSGMPKINREEMAAYVLAVPPTPEQEAIAEVLSDADALIESLEQLIAKKRQIKQGTMQALLTGKQRLPGFGGPWEMTPLGGMAEIVMGQSPSSRSYNAKGIGLPLIQGNADVSNRKTIERVFTTEPSKKGRCGDVLLSVRAPVGEVCLASTDVCLGRGVCAVQPMSIDKKFLYHALTAAESLWAKLSKGSTFDSVNSDDVRAFTLVVPLERSEQTAIATILTDMDTELAELETRLAKTRQLKQGMMQELLTGRIRLV